MNKLRLIFAAVALAGTLSLSAMAPASADGAASTRNIILGAAAGGRPSWAADRDGSER